MLDNRQQHMQLTRCMKALKEEEKHMDAYKMFCVVEHGCQKHLGKHYCKLACISKLSAHMQYNASHAETQKT